ncbi:MULTISPECIES: hypothetical protein [unclassified Streptomyces]|uniref:hypothetical protein n=1 Tax=unclassified Streptomyces TaxID=2593676 RepID=UPI00381116E0
MELIAFTADVFALGVHALLGWPYGAMGLVGLALLARGATARRHGSACAGAVVLALLLIPPGA